MTGERLAKLTLRVGEKEVCLEAGVDVAAAELHRLASLMLTSGDGDPASLTLTAPGQARDAGHGDEPAVGDAGPLSPEASRLASHAALDPRRAARLYSLDNDALALTQLPVTGRDSTADALLLLLYGHLVLRGRARVSALDLLRCARDSGLALRRANRYFKGRSRWVTSLGSHRAIRFQLTESGVEHCEELLQDLLPAL